MALSKRCIETLVDLVEIKLSTIHVFDRENAKEQTVLEACRDELSALARGAIDDLVPVIYMEFQRDDPLFHGEPVEEGLGRRAGIAGLGGEQLDRHRPLVRPGRRRQGEEERADERDLFCQTPHSHGR